MDTMARSWDTAQWDRYNWMYYRLTESVDAQIGRVLNALEKSGLDKSTIIVFTSDHGDMHGAHQLILKNVMFEECQRIPFMFAGHGIKQNYVDTTTLVCNGLDFLPTICDLAGIPYPKELPGISLKPYLTGNGEKPHREYIITEGYNADQITDGRFKYTVYELPGYPELLTDLQVNPGEIINYANDPARSEMKTTLKKELMLNLDQRGLTPLPEDRTIKNLRAIEKRKKTEKNKNKKSDRTRTEAGE